MPSYIELSIGEGVVDWSAAINGEMEQKVGRGFRDKMRWFFEEVSQFCPLDFVRLLFILSSSCLSAVCRRGGPCLLS